MAEVNWALQQSGGRVIDVSCEPADPTSSAENLLRPHEDAQWATGPPPQHVTLALFSRHPPLEYAGWHVGQDAQAAPKVVEIAAGASPEQLRPLLVCEALSGAGTQVWRLPQPIPAEQRYVRFTVLESFGSGPTCMTTLVLLEKDPGSHYNANGESAGSQAGLHVDAAAAAPAASTPPDVPIAGSDAHHQRSLLPSTGDRSPPPHPAGINESAVSGASRIHDAGERSDVGLFVTRTRSSHTLSGAGRQERGRSAQGHTARLRSNSRMSQLLRDLDDDIKLLRPIKSVTASKNMLMYLPQESPGMELDSLEERLLPERDNRRGSAASVDSTENDGGHRRDRNGRRSSVAPAARRGESGRGGGSDGNGRDSAAVSGLDAGAAMEGRRLQPRTNSAQLDVALFPAAAPAAAVLTNAGYEARLCALEQAVAALNQTVQHQRDDLTMIKRLLLQQAAERRKEAEQRYEERQRFDHATNAAAHTTVAVGHPQPPAAATAAAAAAPANGGFLGDQHLTHRSITVDFPEDALRVFVESVLEQRLRKHNKKLEAKLLQRLDRQLHDVIKVLSATVEGQLANVAAAAAAVPVMQSSFVVPMGTSQASGSAFRSASHASVGGGQLPREQDRDRVPSTPPRRGGHLSPASSHGESGQTPVSQREAHSSAAGAKRPW